MRASSQAIRFRLADLATVTAVRAAAPISSSQQDMPWARVSSSWMSSLAPPQS
jgi:hypothetical protein